MVLCLNHGDKFFNINRNLRFGFKYLWPSTKLMAKGHIFERVTFCVLHNEKNHKLIYCQQKLNGYKWHTEYIILFDKWPYLKCRKEYIYDSTISYKTWITRLVNWIVTRPMNNFITR